PTIVSIVFQYNPNKVAAAVAGGLYFSASLCLFTRLFMNKAWWGLCLPIGSTFMSIGLFMRIPMAMYPNSSLIFMAQEFYTLLTPAAFFAFNYILYGRFIVNCVDKRYSWIKPERVTRYFVISDITAFLIQGGGAGLQVSKNATTDKLGSNILIAGIAVQAFSFAFFIFLVVLAWRSILRDGILPRQEPWGPILRILMFSSIAFMIRCNYRVAELVQGKNGYFLIHEIYFYLFDSLPLLIGISTYIFYWPTKYLDNSAKTAHQMSDLV
ncbi:RTA1 like protein-domain-containing protein, partial [Suillus clintonianus]|uniref:RTA1 like protein-domain-containing protein n=1 Tax=Suillus clintonianus TaxID=1904413 RepID=UPI001B8802CE